VQEFNAALKKNPNDDRVYYYLGNALEKIPRLTDALEMFASVPPSSRYFSQSQIHRAFILVDQGNLKEAQRVTADAVARKPDDPDLYRFLASLYEKDSKYLEAITALREALKVKPEDEDILFYLGVLYDKASLPQESIAAMQEVLKRNNRNADALNFIGYTYADKGVNLDEAERLIKKALKLKPDDGYIIDSLGWVYFRQGKIKKAIQKLQLAVRRAPDDPVIAEHLGDAYSAAGDTENALAQYRKAYELDPSKTAVIQKIDALTAQ
jgi:tetratricopeptide (TPR) repeat protein